VPIDVRSMAVTLAVTGFFVLGFVGWLGGLCPLVCCKRALMGAVAAYAVTTLVAHAVNAILIDAMATRQAQRQVRSDHDNAN